MIKYLIIPKWFFSQNIGDSVISTFLPRIIKHQHPNDQIIVITSHELVEIFQDIKEVDSVYLPSDKILSIPDKEWSKREIQYSIFPVDYIEVFNLWNSRFDFFYNHPTINKITLNYLYQNKLEHLVDTNLDFSPEIHERSPSNSQLDSHKTLIGIVPADKLSGRLLPHPGCNGKGYRLNGDNGESWKKLTELIKDLIPSCQIVEFTKGPPKFGDISTNTNSIKELAWYAKRMNIGIMSDGGIHHIFNSQKTKVVLTRYKIAVTELFKLENSTEFNHPICLKNCTPHIKNLTQWSDINKFCTGHCEQLSVEDIAQLTKKLI